MQHISPWLLRCHILSCVDINKSEFLPGLNSGNNQIYKIRLLKIHLNLFGGEVIIFFVCVCGVCVVVVVVVVGGGGGCQDGGNCVFCIIGVFLSSMMKYAYTISAISVLWNYR